MEFTTQLLFLDIALEDLLCNALRHKTKINNNVKSIFGTSKLDQFQFSNNHGNICYEKLLIVQVFDNHLPIDRLKNHRSNSGKA